MAPSDRSGRELVAGAATGATIDFVDEVAARLPATVICELIGVPDADRDHVTETTQAAFGGATSDPTPNCSTTATTWWGSNGASPLTT